MITRTHTVTSHSHDPSQKKQNDTLKVCKHHVTAKPHTLNFVIALCLHSSGQGKENIIWSSFMWNSLFFPSSGNVPENWGMAQNVGLGGIWEGTRGQS